MKEIQQSNSNEKKAMIPVIGNDCKDAYYSCLLNLKVLGSNERIKFEVMGKESPWKDGLE